MAKTKSKDRKAAYLGILFFLLAGGVALALWFFFNSHPRWDPTGNRRFKEWALASLVGLVLLVFNVVAWRLLRKEGLKNAKSRIWPVLYGVAGLFLVLPWAYFALNGTSSYEIVIGNAGQTTLMETSVQGRGFRLGNDTLWPGQDLRRKGIRTPFPKDGQVQWRVTTPGAQVAPSEIKHLSEALPVRPGSKGKILWIEINGKEATAEWHERSPE